MIRPHSRDFCYDEDDFESMKATLQLMNNLGADGFVFGILHKAPDHRSADRNSWVDTARNKELVQLAAGKPCTFHRAFDCIPESDWDPALEDIMECGFAAILTSGGPSSENAVDCMDGLADLVNRQSRNPGSHSQAGHRALEVIVGGGVRPTNIAVLREKTLANNFHSSGLSPSSGIVSLTAVQDLKHSLLYQTPDLSGSS
jgi:copper homeostasis protein